jgi:Fe-S cluster biogenesis protein NfuA
MVSNQKIKFFVKRLEQIEKQQKEAIEKRHPEIKVEYKDLIGAGKGVMKSEAEIRKIIGNTYRHSCPPVVEVLDLFTFNGERQEAQKLDAARVDAMDREKAELKAKVKSAMDLVYFGTDEQLLAAINGLEAV